MIFAAPAVTVAVASARRDALTEINSGWFSLADVRDAVEDKIMPNPVLRDALRDAIANESVEAVSIIRDALIAYKVETILENANGTI